MKKLIVLTSLMMLSLTTFSQTGTNNQQEPVKCLPVSVFKKITKDLLKGDSAMAELNLCNEEIGKLEQKVSLKDSVIVTMEEKEVVYKKIITAHEEKYKILEDYTKSVEMNLKKEKLKGKFKSFIGGGLILVLSGLLIL